MGYDLHITRKDFWADPDGPVISLEEWLEYRASDPEVSADDENLGPEYSLYTARHEPWPLWWDGGEIYTKNPDANVVAKLVSIAKALGAKVQGDDGELYGTSP